MSEPDRNEPTRPEVSVVMPCLNEADTVAACVEKAIRCLRENGVHGEVVLADNGSTDGSRELAAAAGARVVPVADRGYGAALIGGIAAAKGRFVIMGDADDSYDFLDLAKFVDRLRKGADLVQGCRLPAGGGTVMPGAMPFLHRWWGNPMFTFMARWMFRAPIHDIYCGLRGFRREWQQGLRQRCTGMEFATEMLIKGSLSGARIEEVPITLHPDGRKAHAPHLKTFRDGWRTLRFFFLCSPRWLFLIPGGVSVLAGLLVGSLAWGGATFGRAHLDAHTLLAASVMVVCGWQAVLFGIFANTFAVQIGLFPENATYHRFYRFARLERGIIASALAVVLGVGLWGAAFVQWREVGYGPLDYARTLRFVIPGATLVSLGLQTFFGSFLVSLLGLKRS
jgi:glycosyltransferase involved in cell wall biosynthesis